MGGVEYEFKKYTLKRLFFYFVWKFVNKLEKSAIFSIIIV